MWPPHSDSKYRGYNPIMTVVVGSNPGYDICCMSSPHISSFSLAFI